MKVDDGITNKSKLIKGRQPLCQRQMKYLVFHILPESVNIASLSTLFVHHLVYKLDRDYRCGGINLKARPLPFPPCGRQTFFANSRQTPKKSLFINHLKWIL